MAPAFVPKDGLRRVKNWPDYVVEKHNFVGQARFRNGANVKLIGPDGARLRLEKQTLADRELARLRC